MTPPTVLTARDLMARGYTRSTAYRMMDRVEQSQHVEGLPRVVDADATGRRGPRRVRALAMGAT